MKLLKLPNFILEVQINLFLLYMCILHIHALLNLYSVGDKPLGFTVKDWIYCAAFISLL